MRQWALLVVETSRTWRHASLAAMCCVAPLAIVGCNDALPTKDVEQDKNETIAATEECPLATPQTGDDAAAALEQLAECLGIDTSAINIECTESASWHSPDFGIETDTGEWIIHSSVAHCTVSGAHSGVHTFVLDDERLPPGYAIGDNTSDSDECLEAYSNAIGDSGTIEAAEEAVDAMYACAGTPESDYQTWCWGPFLYAPLRLSLVFCRVDHHQLRITSAYKASETPY